MDRIAVIGATGLIGTGIAAALAARGALVVGLVRHVVDAARRQPSIEWKAAEVGSVSSAQWAVLLQGVTAVVNCAGALQDGPSDDLRQTHQTGLAEVNAGCTAAGVKRFIHFSAMGVDRATPTAFSTTKLAGDDLLSASELDWIILRPSVVLGASVYGASGLLRELSSLPILPVMPDTGALRPVALEDVVSTVEFFLQDNAPLRVAVELSGPERFEFVEFVRLYRGWLGVPPAAEIAIPGWRTWRIAAATSRADWVGDRRSAALQGRRSHEARSETTRSGRASPVSSPGASRKRSKPVPHPFRIGGSPRSIC